jgi:curved DNA-binding protein CbpA
MSASPIDATPYETLGVHPDASTDELRRAYRRMLRATHPDTGGVAVQFHAVQAAWELVGSPADRASYDGAAASGARPNAGGGMPRASAPQPGSFAPTPPQNLRGTRPAPREYGLAGAFQRDEYIDALNALTPTPVTDPYEARVVRAAPLEVRALLAKALAEEATAELLGSLGIGYTIWHGIATATGAPGEPDEKLDHLVLGASGLFAILSADWGSPVRTRKGELIGSALGPDERPVNALTIRARWAARSYRVPVTAAVVVVPDGGSDESAMFLGSMRGLPVLVVWRSRLPDVMRRGIGDPPFRGGAEVFELRTRITAGVRYL